MSKKSSSKTVALVDGDIIAYRAGFAGEHKKYTAIMDGKPMTFESKTELNNYVKDNNVQEFEWESQLTVEPLEFVLSTVKNMLEYVKDELNTDKVEVYLSGPTNYRTKVATIAPYKGNRDNMRRPILHGDIVDYLKKFHGAETREWLEADDILAIRAKELASEGLDPVIVSIDKDLKQIPCKHFNFVTGERVKISPQTGIKNLYKQVLTGDSTDNVPGIEGIGPVKAAKLIDNLEWHDDICNTVVEAWAKHLLKDQMAYNEADEHEAYMAATGIVDELLALLSVGDERIINEALKAREAGDSDKQAGDHVS